MSFENFGKSMANILTQIIEAEEKDQGEGYIALYSPNGDQYNPKAVLMSYDEYLRLLEKIETLEKNSPKEEIIYH